jgi:hypothetical protein
LKSKPLHDGGARRLPDRADVSPTASAAPVSAWEMIEVGRFMPRRIRGSFPGRELG